MTRRRRSIPHVPHVPHVLHLLEPRAGEDAILACKRAMTEPAFTHEFWLLGSDSDEARARDFGLASVDRVSASFQIGPFAWRGLRRLATARFSVVDAPELVQCWSVTALAASARAFGNGVPRVGVVTPAPPTWTSDSHARRVVPRALAGGAAAPTLVCFDAGAHASWQAWGTPDVRILPPPLLPDAATPSRIESLRAALLGPEHASDLVIGLIADPPGVGDSRTLAFMLGLCYASGKRIGSLLPRGCGQMRRTAVYLRAHARRWAMAEVTGPYHEALAACDGAFWLAPDRGGATLALHAARLGVPIIAPASVAADRINSLCPGAITPVAEPSPTRIAAVLLSHLGDRHLVRKCFVPPAALDSEGDAFVPTLAELWREVLRIPSGVNPLLPASAAATIPAA